MLWIPIVVLGTSVLGWPPREVPSGPISDVLIITYVSTFNFIVILFTHAYCTWSSITGIIGIITMVTSATLIILGILVLFKVKLNFSLLKLFALVGCSLYFLTIISALVFSLIYTKADISAIITFLHGAISLFGICFILFKFKKPTQNN